MRRTLELQVQRQYMLQYDRGYPLIMEEAVVQTTKEAREEGMLICLRDASGKYIGTGYYGIQNKGIGWLLTNHERETIDTAFFKKKLAQAVRLRRTFFSKEDTTAFRLFNGEGDGIGGLNIDYYANYIVINWYSEGIYTFKEDILQAVQEVLPECKGIYEKRRFAKNGQYLEGDDFVAGEKAPEPLIVQENGMNYAVYLNDGAMVGIFLDQRDVRKAIRNKYAGRNKSALNTFSYTGAFSVPAALNGAHTTSVDVANRSREKTREQFTVNGIDADGEDIIVMDVFEYFKYAKRKELSFDLVILDPPSFARTKKTTFRSAKDYPKLLKQAIELTNHGGYIVASTNNATISMKKFKQWVQDSFKDLNERYSIREEFGLPSDFRTNRSFKEGSYLKVLVIEKH